jgi:hypothetical protein
LAKLKIIIRTRSGRVRFPSLMALPGLWRKPCGVAPLSFGGGT